MLVDSYRFLPRSFVPMYENATPLPGETEPVWSPFPVRLAEASIAIVSSAGLSIEDEQSPFDVQRERREPSWGDPTHRVIRHLCAQPLAMNHLHVNTADVLATERRAPTRWTCSTNSCTRAASASGGAEPRVSDGLSAGGARHWRTRTAPAIIELLRDQRTHGVVFAPV